MNYIYGPIPSRRLGKSLGISPIPKKTCNYACIYCQLGKTDHMTNEPARFFAVDDMLDAFDSFLEKKIDFDVVTIVGEGEPTLFLDLGALIAGIKNRTDKPLAVITNGSLLTKPSVREALMRADIVLPSLDAYDEKTFKAINRPHGKLHYEEVYQGLIDFSKAFSGALWLEIMLIKGVNDDKRALKRFKERLAKIDYDKLYLNAPVRPPAEANVQPTDEKTMRRFTNELKGISIDLLTRSGFHSAIENDYEAIMSIIRRHPMNQYELSSFLGGRGCKNKKDLLDRLRHDEAVEVIRYRTYETYRLK
jgi:wyosine [tRNA(Phe)-imidazoG37] synthetase (radical SAM superfamily)